MRILMRLLPWSGAVATGLLLAASYAPFARSELAWIALLPLLVAVARAAPRRSFLLGWLAGSVFWLVSMFWLTRVTVAGWLGLSLYCAAYVGLFALGVSFCTRSRSVDKFLPNVALMLGMAALWVAGEFVRAHLLTGFPWNPLGLSQYGNLPLIQFASLGGVYLISGIIVWVNAGLAVTVLRYVERKGRWGQRPHLELFFGMFLLCAGLFTGTRLNPYPQTAHIPLRAAVVQTAIPQDEKWDREKLDLIYARLSGLTAEAATNKPDIIIWPETALPDDVRYSPPSLSIVRDALGSGSPILAGSMDRIPAGPESWIFYNSSFLFETDADDQPVIAGEYRKRHLVPFGEYVPFRHSLPFLKAMTPIQESFDAGRTSTVLRLQRAGLDFSVLICFEDTVPELARESVRNGARLLINQTNDAWFDPWWAQWQHMAQSVFRAVENGVPVIRCANTGVSCFIERTGRVRTIVADAAGRVGSPGTRTETVAVPAQGFQPTVYMRYGDVFAWSCVAGAALLIAAAGLRSRRVAAA